MLRFAANLSMMFTELEPPQRFAAAAAAGFKAAEYLAPQQHPLADLRAWLRDSGLELILINTPAGNAAAGERGLGALPGREADFRAAFDLSMEYATGLGVKRIHVMAGVVPEGASVARYDETFVANLRHAAVIARSHGISLLLEPLNTRDVPGYLHSDTAHAP